MSLFGIKRLQNGKYEVATNWATYVAPDLGSAVRLRWPYLFYSNGGY